MKNKRKKFQKAVSAVALAVTLCATSTLHIAKANQLNGSDTDVTYLKGSSVNDLVTVMQSYGFVAFGTLTTQGHQHMNAIADTLGEGSLLSELTLRTKYNTPTETYVRNFAESTGDTIKIGYKTDTLYIGEDNTLESINNGAEYSINGLKADNPGEIIKDTSTEKYIDLENLQKSFIAYNKQLAAMENTSGITLRNDGSFYVTAESGNLVYNIDKGNVSNINEDARIFFPENSTASVVLNIDMNGIDNWSTKPLVLCMGTSEATFNEDVFTTNTNRIYYNFYNSAADDGLYHGTVSIGVKSWGTYIIPAGDFHSTSNTCGTIIANNIKSEGENHRANAYNPVIPKVPAEETTSSSEAETTSSEEETTSSEEETTSSKEETTSSEEETTSSEEETTSSEEETTSSKEETTAPAVDPSEEETTAPVVDPSEEETTTPAVTPSEEETTAPVVDPSEEETTAPAVTPSEEETTAPVVDPSEEETTTPAVTPSEEETTAPVVDPSEEETTAPAVTPSEEETTAPVVDPSEEETTTPIVDPSEEETTTPAVVDPSVDDNDPTVPAEDETTPATPEEEESEPETVKGSLSITIIDSKTEELIPYANVEIFDESDNLIKETKSDENGNIFLGSLPIGDYTIKVISVPYGYEIPDIQKSTVIGNKTTESLFTVEKDVTDDISESDEVGTEEGGTLKVTITEDSTGKIIPGAQVSIKDSEGKVIFTATSDEDGVITIDSVLPGDYVVSVTEVPDGYTIPKEQAVKVSADKIKDNGIGQNVSTAGSTGDSFSIAIIVALFASFAVLVGMFISIRKKEKNNKFEY